MRQHNTYLSSASHMVKFPFTPTFSACRRRNLAHTEWNVPMCIWSALPFPNIFSNRFRISSAALLVKVTAHNDDGRKPWLITRWATRDVRTLVLPLPGPASIWSGIDGGCSTANGYIRTWSNSDQRELTCLVAVQDLDRLDSSWVEQVHGSLQQTQIWRYSV